MSKRVKILEEKNVFHQAIFTIRAARLQHELYDGTMGGEIVRLNLERGDSVAALVHDPEADTLVFTEQFRYPTLAKGPGWLLELPAGALEQGEEPEERLAQELYEEIGYRTSYLERIGTFYVSPGGTSERIILYYASVRRSDQLTAGGGETAEGEDIKVVTMPVSDALEALEQERVLDAKTIIGLQWLSLNPQRKAGPSGNSGSTA